MGRKRRGNSGWELLRYPGLGFVLDGTPALVRSRGSWIPFVRPAAYVSLFIIEERPQEEVAGIDVPLPSRTREEEGEIYPDVPPTVQPPEGNDPPRPPKDPPAAKDALEYVPREIEIPLGKNGLPGKWCSFHQSANHNLDDCREINDTQIRKKMENATPAVSSGTSAGTVPKSRDPGRPKHGRVLRSKESTSRPSSTLRLRPKKKQPNSNPWKVPASP